MEVRSRAFPGSCGGSWWAGAGGSGGGLSGGSGSVVSGSAFAGAFLSPCGRHTFALAVPPSNTGVVRQSNRPGVRASNGAANAEERGTPRRDSCCDSGPCRWFSISSVPCLAAVRSACDQGWRLARRHGPDRRGSGGYEDQSAGCEQNAMRLGCGPVAVWARRRRRRRTRHPELGSPESLVREVLRTGPKRADEWQPAQQRQQHED